MSRNDKLVSVRILIHGIAILGIGIGISISLTVIPHGLICSLAPRALLATPAAEKPSEKRGDRLGGGFHKDPLFLISRQRVSVSVRGVGVCVFVLAGSGESSLRRIGLGIY